MTLKPVSPAAAVALRDEVEEIIAAALAAETRSFIKDVRESVLSGLSSSPEVVHASALPHGEIPSLGALAGRWAAGVDASVVTAVAVAFDRVWMRYTTQGLIVDSAAERAMRSYISSVRDRLVQGTYFGVTVYDDAFDAVRVALAGAVGEGWTRQELAQRIATELSWETDGAYWRAQKASVDGRIDAILDQIGPPGHPGREYARLNDPRVQALRRERNRAIRHLDAERSVWETRAMLISRTEATGVANYGALEALGSEGSVRKMWLSTEDNRTRDSHRGAPLGVGGTVVGLSQAFMVGGAALQFPGDAAGPVEEVANCRCAMVDPDNL